MYFELKWNKTLFDPTNQFSFSICFKLRIGSALIKFKKRLVFLQKADSMPTTIRIVVLTYFDA